MPLTPDRITALIEEVAAEEIVPRFQALADDEVREKIGGELVTVADEAVEQRLTRAFRDIYPGSTVVGEEAVGADPDVFTRLSQDRPIWIIDPVDGTGNFARGRRPFVVMVALLEGGATHLAWIHDPLAGRSAVAEAGAGATIDGRRLRVSAGQPLAALRGSLHAGQFASPEMKRRVDARRHRLNAVKSLRCAGAEYLRLADGELDFSLFTKMMPWDHAPGVLIHGEAGGVGLQLDGSAYDPTQWTGPGLLLAPDIDAWHGLRDLLFGDEALPRTAP